MRRESGVPQTPRPTKWGEGCNIRVQRMLRGEGSGRLHQRLTNGLDHAFEVAGYVIIREPDEPITLRRKPGVTLFIANVVDVVCSAIKLDDELAFDAGKVGDESTDCVLAADLQSIEAPVAEGEPEELFGSCGLAAKLTGIGVDVHLRRILQHS